MYALTGLDIKVLVLPAPGQVVLNFYLPLYKIYLPNINLGSHIWKLIASGTEILLTQRAGSSQLLPALTQYLPAPDRRAMLNIKPCLIYIPTLDVPCLWH